MLGYRPQSGKKEYSPHAVLLRPWPGYTRIGLASRFPSSHRSASPDTATAHTAPPSVASSPHRVPWAVPLSVRAPAPPPTPPACVRESDSARTRPALRTCGRSAFPPARSCRWTPAGYGSRSPGLSGRLPAGFEVIRAVSPSGNPERIEPGSTQFKLKADFSLCAGADRHPLLPAHRDIDTVP